MNRAESKHYKRAESKTVSWRRHLDCFGPQRELWMSSWQSTQHLPVLGYVSFLNIMFSQFFYLNCQNITMYNHLEKEFITYCNNGTIIIQQDILFTETGNDPSQHMHLSRAPPGLYFVCFLSFSLCSLSHSEKHLGSLWWPFQCFYMFNLTAEVFVNLAQNVWMKVEILIVNVIFFCKMTRNLGTSS